MAIAPKPQASSPEAALKKAETAIDSIEKKVKNLKSIILNMKDQLALAMPKHMDPDRIARIAMTVVSQNPRLAECTQESFLGCLLTSAQLGLEPNTKLGEAWLIPYAKNKKMPDGTWEKVLECTFQLGYKGLVVLCERTKIYSRIDMNYVLATDTFDYGMGFDTYLKHKRGPKDIGDVVQYYALYETVSGGRNFKVWSKEKVTAHAKRFSQAYDKKDSPWQEHFDSMAMKTVLIDLLKTAPKSVEVAKGASIDGAVIKYVPPAPGTIEANAPGELVLAASFEHLEEEQPTGETQRVLAAAEIEQKEKVRLDILAKVEERLSERIKGGMDIPEFEKKIGMSIDAINDLDSQQLMTVIEVLGK